MKLKQAKILIIDDDKEILAVLKDGLELPGFETVIMTSDNPIDGLQLTKQHIPDVVILDLRMPQGSGFEFIQKLKKIESLRRTKVLMLTADSSRKNLWESVDKDIDGFLAKPFDLLELESHLMALLQKDKGTSMQI